MNSLNRHRAEIVVSYYLKNKKVLLPGQVAYRESIFPFSQDNIILGASLTTEMNAKEMFLNESELKTLKEMNFFIQKVDQCYLIFLCTGVDNCTIMNAFVSALFMNNQAVAYTERVKSDVDVFFKEIEHAGWDLNANVLNPLPIRLDAKLE